MSHGGLSTLMLFQNSIRNESTGNFQSQVYSNLLFVIVLAASASDFLMQRSNPPITSIHHCVNEHIDSCFWLCAMTGSLGFFLLVL